MYYNSRNISIDMYVIYKIINIWSWFYDKQYSHLIKSTIIRLKEEEEKKKNEILLLIITIIY